MSARCCSGAFGTREAAGIGAQIREGVPPRSTALGTRVYQPASKRAAVFLLVGEIPLFWGAGWGVPSFTNIMGGLGFLKFWKRVSVEGAFDVFPQ